jgi:hypothetical protein
MKYKKNRKSEIYKLGYTLCLQKKEVDLIINDNSRNKQISFTAGPNWYPGAHYGSISIYDF